VAALNDMPVALVERALRAATTYDDRNLLRQFWNKVPTMLETEALKCVDNDHWHTAQVLFESAPQAIAARLLSNLRERFLKRGISDQFVHFVRPWLHQLVVRRHETWRSAYAFLAEIEQRLGRVRHASHGI
jgi:hypothetical protein